MKHAHVFQGKSEPRFIELMGYLWTPWAAQQVVVLEISLNVTVFIYLVFFIIDCQGPILCNVYSKKPRPDTVWLFLVSPQEMWRILFMEKIFQA